MTDLSQISLPLSGGCLCGALRYEVSALPVDAGYCHCRICQRLSGAPAMAWVSVPTEGFRYTVGAPRVHRSSDWGQREFCARCGSQLLYRTREPAPTLDVNSPTLDDPEVLEPRRHVWVGSRLPWFHTADALPEHSGNGPVPPEPARRGYSMRSTPR